MTYRESVVVKKARKQRLITRARGLITRAERAGRDFTDAEQRESDGLLADLEALSADIETQERDEQHARDAAPPPRRAWGDERDLAGYRRRTGGGRGMYRDERLEAFARGEEGRRASLTIDLSEAAEARAAMTRDTLTVGAQTGGGATVPTGFVGRLYEHLIESSGVRQANPTVLTTQAGEDLSVPTTSSHGTAAIVAEGAVIGEDDPAFNAVTLGAHKYGLMVKVTSELLTDTSVNLTEYLSRSFGRAIGNASGQHFVTGTGTGQPEGALTGSTLGVTTASGSTITADEVMSLFFSVIPPYRRNGYWMMSDATWATVRKLKDADGNYLIGPLAGGSADLRLMGRPVVIDPNMPEIALSARTILFGDFAGYYLRQVQTVRFERSDHIGFSEDLVYFRCLHRLDGRLVDTSGGLKHLQMAAA